MADKHVAVLSSQPEKIRINYLDLRPVTQEDEKGTILLIHGFPQTSYQFRHVISALSKAGYRVVAPDYRGSGHSSKPASDFTKETMAKDFHHLLYDHLKISSPLHLVGHDIGGMIAFAYALLFPDEVSSLCWGECPLPGTTYYDTCKASLSHFHFLFHAVRDLPEALVAGKEREYITHFFDKLTFNMGAFAKEDVDQYVEMYAKPGAMRCAFEVYRAFEEDAAFNRARLEEKGKVKLPTLTLFGEQSEMLEGMESMKREFFEDGEARTVPGAKHYVAEENPVGFVEIILQFLGESSRRP